MNEFKYVFKYKYQQKYILFNFFLILKMRIIKIPKLNRNQAINETSINSTGEFIAIAETSIFIFKIQDLNTQVSNYEKELKEKKENLNLEPKQNNNLIDSTSKTINVQETLIKNDSSKQEAVIIIDNGYSTNAKHDNNTASKEDKKESSGMIIDDENYYENNELNVDEDSKQAEKMFIQEREQMKESVYKNVHIIIDDNLCNVNTLNFFNTKANLVISGGMDKSVLIHLLDYDRKNFICQRNIPLGTEVSEIKLFKNDKFALISCFDNVVYVIHCELSTNNFTLSYKFDVNNSVVQSIAVDPLGSYKFITFSETKKIYFCELFHIPKYNNNMNNNHNLKNNQVTVTVNIRILKEISDYESNEVNHPPFKKIR
jgi:hypothetical protein